MNVIEEHILVTVMLVVPTLWGATPAPVTSGTGEMDELVMVWQT